jgi:MFS superfamily sulfate permease-like transporter
MVEDQKIIVKQCSRKQIIIMTICAAVILLSGIVIGVGSTILLAQNRFIKIEHSHKTADDIAKKISAEYALNAQQTAQVQTLLTDIFEKGKLRHDEMDVKRDADAEMMIAQMKLILTEEQFAKWNENFSKLREKFKKNR